MRKLTRSSKWWENRKASFERDDEDVGNHVFFPNFEWITFRIKYFKMLSSESSITSIFKLAGAEGMSTK